MQSGIERTSLEILSPAGNAECARAALNAGADAIYLGYGQFSARASAENFDGEGMKSIIDEAHFYGAKVYVAMNTLVKDSELKDFVAALLFVWSLGADAIIIQDIFLGKAIKKSYPKIVLHLSTQAGVCNVNGALLAKEYGFSRVILARETPLAEIGKIAEIIETEVFVQGALCTCFSGQCYFSSFVGGQSGNRGRCKQPCRKKYAYDRTPISKDGAEKAADVHSKNYALSLSDLSVGEDISALIKAGVTSFKIEGRMRRKEYVAAATEYYAKILSGVSDAEKTLALSDLKRAYNRGNYTKGLAFLQDKRLLSPYVQGHIGERAGTVKVIGGKYFVESGYAFSAGDAFKIVRDKEEIGGATFVKNDKRGFYISSKTRLKNGDGVFVTTDNRSLERVLSVRKNIPVTLKITMDAGEYGVATDGNVTVRTHGVLERATGRALTEEEIKECFLKSDSLPVDVRFFEVKTSGAFLPKSLLNAFRREFYAALKADRTKYANEQYSADDFFYFSYLQSARDGAETQEKIAAVTENAAASQEEKIVKIARSFSAADDQAGVRIAVLKPDDYGALCAPEEKKDSLFGDFCGEKYLYYPAFCKAETEEAISRAIKAGMADGVYAENYSALMFAKQTGCRLFAGSGFNLTNAVSAIEAIRESSVSYYVLSKEISKNEQEALIGTATKSVRKQAFVLALGGIKLMDLCYCPFGRTCGVCDKRNEYTLTDENGRAFSVRRYKDGSGECRFEIYNCASLIGVAAKNAGRIIDASTKKDENAIKGANLRGILRNEETQKALFSPYTYGHVRNSVI